ncbi:MAG: GntR family transcriptional regulator [Negativicutes bacterium]|nr:GntR family transcriptional regulator [Negativicutes bacterium]
MSQDEKQGMYSSKSLKDTIRQIIRANIIDGRLKPGQRIVETEVAKELQVSPIPIREALCGLEEEGLVTSIKYKGAFVADINMDEMYHMFQLRSLIEAKVIELVLANLSKKNFGELHDIVDAMQEKKSNLGDYSTMSALDIEFHWTIINWSRIEAYKRSWTMLQGHVCRFINFIHPKVQDKQLQEYDDHRLLLEILEERDVEKAKAAIQAHIMDVFDKL